MGGDGIGGNRVLAGLLAGAAGLGLVQVTTNLEHPTTSLFVLFPLAAAVLLPTAQTALVTGVVLLVAADVLWQATGFDAMERVSRMLVLVVMGLASTWLASVRVAREQRLLRMTRVAETAQRAIIRALPTAVGRVTLAARYLSAADDALVGGDLYEVTPTPHGVRLIIGDVRGKGLDAVKLASTVLGAFRFHAAQEPSLAVLARRLDEVVRTEIEHSSDLEDFVTAMLVEVDDDLWVRYVPCGHPSPLVVHRDDAHLLEILTHMPPLGLCERLTTQSTRWEPGTRVLLYTDGLAEARDAHGRFFPVEREAGTLRGPSLEGSLDVVVDHVMAHSGSRLQDDLALVLLECR